MNPKDIFILTVAIATLGSLTLACSHRPASVAPVAVPTQVVETGDEPTNDLPTDLYRGMPQYPGSKVTRVGKPRREMREIVFSSDGTMPELVSFYKDNLKKQGFHITGSLVMSARQTWSCDFQREGRPATLLVYPTVPGKSKMTIDLVYVMPVKNDPALLEPVENFDVVGPGPVAAASNPNPSTKRN